MALSCVPTPQPGRCGVAAQFARIVRHRYSRHMTFRKSRSTKGRVVARHWSENELIWGVPRRPGYDDQDDPKAHAGLTQHAFEPGNDETAICGFEPPKRSSGPLAKPRPQLAMPSARLNPRCPKCARLVLTPSVPVPPLALAAIDAVTPAVSAAPAQPPSPARVGAASAAKNTKPESARSEAWEGTALLGAGDMVAMVRPPSQPGLGVVASVVSGPSGTRVASVNMNADGLAVITLSEPAGAPVTVAWFAVPAVDPAAQLELPVASSETPPETPPHPTQETPPDLAG
jgi:hypothetical protein